ncbi:MAG TPA: cation:proton antiporter [Actinomycetota bacterium]|nr:cation:proton antiporter [Actinomycetota bacterium]
MSSGLFFIELGVIVLGLAILARLAARIGLSPIPLYLLAGLAFGKGGLLPVVTAEDFIEIGAEIGVILLLLMLGLEYSAEELTATLRGSARPGLLDLVLSFSPGFAFALILGWSPLSAVFLGGVTYISSSGIVAKQLDELEWVGNRETPVVLSLLVIEDLVMAAYLPLVAALLQGGDIGVLAVTVALALAAAGTILVLAVRFGNQLSRLVFSHSDEALLLSIIGVTLAVAGLAERVHISAAVGAFLVGIALSGDAADRARDLLRPLRDLFAAVFFVFFGLAMEPATIPSALPVAATLAVVTALTKVVTGWSSAKAAGVGPRGRLRAGALLIARGEFSLVVAGIAVTAGLEPELGPIAAAYVLILGVLGPVAVRLIDLAQDRQRAATLG